MNDFHIFNKAYSKLSLYKNGNAKVKTNNFSNGIKNMLITNSNGLDISSQYGNFVNNSKKNILNENFNFNHINYNNINNNHNKNLSLPINSLSLNQNINNKYKDFSLINKKYLLKKNNSKENTKNSINITNYNMNGIISNKMNVKENMNQKKPGIKLVNISLNINNVKSLSKSKSKSKNEKENKSHNNKINNNINKMIFDKYIKLYKVGGKEIIKKTKTKNINFLNKDYSNYNISKISNESTNSDLYKIPSFNMATNNQMPGLRKKNKSSNLLITNINKPKNNQSSKTNVNNVKDKNQCINNSIKNITIKNIDKIDNIYMENNNNVKDNKKYLTENHIMYLINKKETNNRKENIRNNKEIKLSLKEISNNRNSNVNINLNNIIIDKKQNEENKEKIIFDYKNNNIFLKKNQLNNLNKNINNTNLILNYENEKINSNSYNLNERLKTEYNENSLENDDKKDEDENIGEANQKSLSLSKNDSYRYLHPEIYIKDDELLKQKQLERNKNREKELDETESPLKIDTDKNTNENSGVLSFDQVKDIICYYNMNNTDKQSDFLFQMNEREIFNINGKNKYLNYFFGNINNDKDKNNRLIDELISPNTNNNSKYPNSSIFSLDTDYSSKLKRGNIYLSKNIL